jgi:hypothetical protein
LAVNPLKGKDCSEIRIGYRKLNTGSHVIFYRQTHIDMIEIVRVLHGHMDIETHFPGVPGTVYAILQVLGTAISLDKMKWNPGQGW